MATTIRPGWLTAIGVIAIVVGTLGILGAITGALSQLYGAAVQERMQNMMATWQQSNGLPTEALELQQDLQREIVAVQLRWRATMLVVAAVGFLVCLPLIAGGIGTLRLASWGRTLLIWALAATIVYEIAVAVPGLMMQQEIMQSTRKFMAEVMQSTQQQMQTAPPGQAQQINLLSNTITNASLVIGLVMTGAWLLVKVGLYAAAIWYLRSPLIRSLFANQHGAREVTAVIAD